MQPKIPILVYCADENLLATVAFALRLRHYDVAAVREVKCAIRLASSKNTALVCGVPVHAVPLRGLATAYARLGARAASGEEGPAAVVEAVRHHPFMLSGTGQLDTLLLEATSGRVLAKVGAEATYGAVDLSSGTGLALKVLDGAPRARAAPAGAFTATTPNSFPRL